mmetsp:Transcript_10310/g.32678  ORF Transcript_10310/g.32678 Transcript_10310/m.32678 type:complete len:274 (+) Transcript_10310:2509-3330(+)
MSVEARRAVGRATEHRVAEAGGAAGSGARLHGQQLLAGPCGLQDEGLLVIVTPLSLSEPGRLGVRGTGIGHGPHGRAIQQLGRGAQELRHKTRLHHGREVRIEAQTGCSLLHELLHATQVKHGLWRQWDERIALALALPDGDGVLHDLTPQPALEPPQGFRHQLGRGVLGCHEHDHGALEALSLGDLARPGRLVLLVVRLGGVERAVQLRDHLRHELIEGWVQVAGFQRLALLAGKGLQRRKRRGAADRYHEAAVQAGAQLAQEPAQPGWAQG